MADRVDITEVDPVLELTLEPSSLECAGTLDFSTRRHVLEALEVLLERRPPEIGIDVSHLQIVDADGANALAVMQRMVSDAGARLRWQGLDEDVLAVLTRDSATTGAESRRDTGLDGHAGAPREGGRTGSVTLSRRVGPSGQSNGRPEPHARTPAMIRSNSATAAASC